MTLSEVKRIELVYKAYIDDIPEVKEILKLCKAYRKLHRLAKNYVQEDHLGNARKLRDELGIEQWW